MTIMTYGQLVEAYVAVRDERDQLRDDLARLRSQLAEAREALVRVANSLRTYTRLTESSRQERKGKERARARDGLRPHGFRDAGDGEHCADCPLPRANKVHNRADDPAA